MTHIEHYTFEWQGRLCSLVKYANAFVAVGLVAVLVAGFVIGLDFGTFVIDPKN